MLLSQSTPVMDVLSCEERTFQDAHTNSHRNYYRWVILGYCYAMQLRVCSFFLSRVAVAGACCFRRQIMNNKQSTRHSDGLIESELYARACSRVWTRTRTRASQRLVFFPFPNIGYPFFFFLFMSFWFSYTAWSFSYVNIYFLRILHFSCDADIRYSIFDIYYLDD